MGCAIRTPGELLLIVSHVNTLCLEKREIRVKEGKGNRRKWGSEETGHRKEPILGVSGVEWVRVRSNKESPRGSSLIETPRGHSCGGGCREQDC